MTNLEKIKNLEAELAAAKEEMRNFSYIVSHDLKQPVRGMKNYATFTLEDFEKDLDEEVVENMKQILIQGDRFDIMMGAVLELSRLNTNRREVDSINLNDLIKSIIDDSLAKEYFEFELTGSVNFNGDPALTTTLFEKIIQNAILYNISLDKKVEILISESDAEISISIKDNGIGVEQKYVRDIFRIFSRLNGQTKFGSRSGTGLTICKKIVSIYKGSIKVNTLEEGSEFVLVFPK
jgi:light-regulated signal transduction histidine kinase (bacteriophytochrome)